MDELRQWWPVISLALTGGIGWLLWSMRQSFAARQDIAELKDQFDKALGEVKAKVGSVSGRVDLVERDVAHLPTMASLQETNIRIERVLGGLDTMRADYRHILGRQERLEEACDRHDQIMSDAARASTREIARDAAREAATGR